MFQSIDNQDTETFLTFLSENVLFRFGNAEPVSGKSATGDAVRGFFTSIKAIHHDVTEIWEQKDVMICHGTVKYTRHDSTTLTVPFANILRIHDNLIKEYLIYIDLSELYGSA